MSATPQDPRTAAVTLVLNILGSPSIQEIIKANRADLVARLEAEGISAPYCKGIAEASLAKLAETLTKRYENSLPLWASQTKGNVDWTKFTEAEVANTQALQDRTGKLYEAICASADEFRSFGWEKDKRAAAESWTKDAAPILKKTRVLQGAMTPRLAALGAARHEYAVVRARIDDAIADIKSKAALAALVPFCDHVSALGSADKLLDALAENVILAPDPTRTVDAIDITALVATIQDATKRCDGERDTASKFLKLLDDATQGLGALIAAREEYAAARSMIGDAVAAVRSNAALTALVPFCDHVAATTLGPADVLLQEVTGHGVLAPFLAQSASEVDGNALARKLGDAKEIFVQEREALKLDELMKCLEVLQTLVVHTSNPEAVRAREFIAVYKAPACFVLARLVAQRRVLLELFYGDRAGNFRAQLNVALFGKLQVSADDKAVCDAQLLEACFLAAFKACDGKPVDKLTETERQKVTAAACACAKAATEVNLEGVTVIGTRISIGPDNVQFPSRFEVPGQFHTDGTCIKHVSEETQGDQSIQRLQAYFAEMVAACKQAKAIWEKNPVQLEVNVYKDGTNKFTADWNICLQRVGNTIEIFHISSGYKNSGWVVGK